MEQRTSHVLGVERGVHVCGTVYLQARLQNADTVKIQQKKRQLVGATDQLVNRYWFVLHERDLHSTYHTLNLTNCTVGKHPLSLAYQFNSVKQ